MNKSEQWKKRSQAVALEQAVDLELPSGVIIRARRPGAMLLAAYGHLPMALATAARGPVPIAELQRQQNVSADFITFMRDILLYSVVEPAISLTPEPDEIHPRDIPDKDAMYIIEWALRGSEAASLETFRAKRSDGSTGDDGAGVGQQAE